MPDIESKYVELTVADGTAMRAWFSQPNGATPKAGLMVFQEVFGITAHIRDVTDRFARQGYAALAPEMYHRTAPGFEGSDDDFPASRAHAQAMTPEGIAVDVRAAHNFLAEHIGDKVAAVGYCLGGSFAYLACATVPLKAAVSYYGGRIADHLDRVSQLTAPMLLLWGGRDKHITSEVRHKVEGALQASKYPSIQVTFSDADHAFFNDTRPSYNAKAAKLSWDLTLSFFDQNLGTTP